MNVDDFDTETTRRTVHGFYEQEYPTLDKLLQVLKEKGLNRIEGRPVVYREETRANARDNYVATIVMQCYAVTLILTRC